MKSEFNYSLVECDCGSIVAEDQRTCTNCKTDVQEMIYKRKVAFNGDLRKEFEDQEQIEALSEYREIPIEDLAPIVVAIISAIILAIVMFA